MRAGFPVRAALRPSTAIALACTLAAAAPSAAQAKRCDPARFRVVVDVGHSAEVPGATSARGVPEYHFNLALAEQVGAALSGAGFSRTVVLVTAGPAMRSLAVRVARANRARADLLVSIHHDSVPEKFLEAWEHEGKPQRFSDRFSGHSIFISHENRFRTESLAFARLLGTQLKARGLRYTPHYAEPFMGWRRRDLLDAEAGVYRFDELKVLRDVRMPAVLLEAGSVVNRADELALATPEQRALIAAAVADAVAGFCAVGPTQTGASR